MASTAITAKTVEVFRDLATSTGTLRRRTYELLLDINKALDASNKSMKSTNTDRTKVLKDILGNNLKSSANIAWIEKCEKKEASVSLLKDLINLLATPSDEAFAKVQDDLYQAAVTLKLCSLDKDTNFTLLIRLITILDDTIDNCKFAVGYAQTTLSICQEDPIDKYNSTVANLVDTQINLLRNLFEEAQASRDRCSQTDNKFKAHGFILVENTIRIIKLESATYRLIEAFKNLHKYCD